MNNQGLLGILYEQIKMQLDHSGSAAWDFAGINEDKESVTGEIEIVRGNQNSILKFINPEFTFHVKDSLYLQGNSTTNREFVLKAVRY